MNTKLVLEYDIEGHSHCVQKYEYSTLRVYLGLKEDKFSIVDAKYILQIFSSKLKKAKKYYKEFMNKCERLL